MVRAGAGGFIYGFFLYGRKESNEVTPYSFLQKSAQVVAKLCVELPRQVGNKVFFDNWFTTLDLMIYLKKEGLPVGKIRSSHSLGCPLLSKKDNNSIDNNSGIITVMWIDNSVVQLTSNYVGIETMDQTER